MPEERTLEINFVQTLVKAINLAMEAHDFCPDSIDVRFFHDETDTGRSEVLSVKVNNTSVTLDLFHQCLRPLYGELEVVERKW